jgi:hypothetical protein
LESWSSSREYKEADRGKTLTVVMPFWPISAKSDQGNCRLGADFLRPVQTGRIFRLLLPSRRKAIDDGAPALCYFWTKYLSALQGYTPTACAQSINARAGLSPVFDFFNGFME